MATRPAIRLDPSKIKDLAPDALDDNGRLRILPAAFWAKTTPDERALFGHRQGIYSFPTVELVEHLREFIGDRTAIEVGSGNGVLAAALGIRATDNYMQDQPKYRLIFAATGQPTVKYGPNVLDMDAHDAIRHFTPDVVIGCWVTHKWDPRRLAAEGNEVGIDENDLLDHVQHYVVIGNDKVHQHKAIWDLPHTKTHPDFIYSRAVNGSPDFLAVWKGKK